jgi:hypothetical protein
LPSTWFDYSDCIWRGEHITKYLILYFSLASLSFVHVLPRYSQQPILIYPLSVFFP